MVPWFLLVFAIASSFDLPGDFLQVINPTVRGIFVALLSLVLWAVVYVAIRSVRKPRFMATHMPRLRALMDAAPLSP
jgi:drug/metabolite transporter (DMT)-like permease